MKIKTERMIISHMTVREIILLPNEMARFSLKFLMVLPRIL
jgi:hypothetical protein